MFAAVAVALVVVAVLVPIAGCEDSGAASSNKWACRITVDGITLTTEYKTGNGSFQPMTAVKGFGDDKTQGSWEYDRTTGYGPFGSFYAAFDPSHSNRMVCHLNPYNLKEALGGGTSVEVDGETVEISKCNIMWCLPKIYLSLEDDGNTMVLASDSSYGGKLAPAFTVGGTDYNYFALGVYEATYDNVSEKLGSVSDTDPKVYFNLTQLRRTAKANEMADGSIALLWNFHQYQLYRLCSLAVMENFDSQAQIGYGNSSHGNTNVVSRTGTMDTEGPYFGTSGQNNDGAKLFIENLWGSVSEYVDDAVWYEDGIWAGQNENPEYTRFGTGNRDGKELVHPISPYGWGISPSKRIDSWGLPTESLDHFDSRGGTSVAPDYVHIVTTGGALMAGGFCESRQEAGLSDLASNDGGSYIVDGSRLVFLLGADTSATAPEVTYDHSDLKALLEEYGYSEDYLTDLPTGSEGSEAYDALGEVAEFKHVGWIVDGVQYPADHPFVKTEDHVAKSVWVGLPAVTYDHSRLIGATGDSDSVAGLSNGLEIKGHYSYEQLPAKNGYAHVGWLIGDMEVGPTDPFVTKQSHTAISLWSAIPTVVLNHHDLMDIVGVGAEGVSALPSSLIIADNPGYIQLPDTAGYRHIGWRVGDVTVGPTAELLSPQTHTAFSVWEKIPEDDGFVPTPDDGRWDEGPYIPEQKESGWGWLGDSKNILVIAILAAIIAELAVLAVSRHK